MGEPEGCGGYWTGAGGEGILTSGAAEEGRQEERSSCAQGGREWEKARRGTRHGACGGERVLAERQVRVEEAATRGGGRAGPAL